MFRDSGLRFLSAAGSISPKNVYMPQRRATLWSFQGPIKSGKVGYIAILLGFRWLRISFPGISTNALLHWTLRITAIPSMPIEKRSPPNEMGFCAMQIEGLKWASVPRKESQCWECDHRNMELVVSGPPRSAAAIAIKFA